MTAEVASAERRLGAVEQDFKEAEANLQRALQRIGNCQQAYAEAPDQLRRQFNQAFFKRLLVDDDYDVTSELTEPFDWLLGDELRRAAAAKDSQALQEAVQATLRRRSESGPDGPKSRPLVEEPGFEYEQYGAPCGTRTRPTGLKVRGSAR